MKKLLLLTIFALYSFTQFGQTTHFEQDFLAGTVTSNFVSPIPSKGQFTEIATATGVTTTITAGRLQFARASVANPTRFSRGFNFTPTPSSMYCQFSFGVTSAAVQATSATFNFGGTNLVDGATTVTDVYSKVIVNLNATNGFTLQSGATVSTPFTGNQDITWVMNNTGATFTYIAPNGTNETLGNDQFDLWVGTTKVFNDLAVNAPTQTINRFKFNFDVGIATLSFDNFLMRDVTGSLLVNTNVTTPDSMLVKYVGTVKNVGIGKNIVTPANKLEIKSDTLDRSGLRFTNLKSTSTTTVANGKSLSVNALGDVVLVNTTASSIPDSMIVKFIGTGLTKNVGIGTITPNNKLEITATQNDKSGLRFTKLNSASTAPTGNGKVLSVDANGDVIIVKDSLGASTNSGWQAITGGRIQNSNTGAVVIGALNTTNLPGNYKLYVKDGIMAEEVKIAVQGTADWADYVFASNYKLRPLSEVAEFVRLNKHLPEVPSAEDVVKNGVNVVKMESKLLEKIEELTLYMIELKKENDSLKRRLDKVEKRK